MSFSRRPRFAAKRTPDSAGVIHASKGQAQWFDTLRTRLRAGEIRDLDLEPSFPIVINGQHVCDVKADARFVEIASGRVCVLDYKGVEGDTPISRLKRKLVAAAHGIEIEIVGPAQQAKDRKARTAAAKRALKKAAKMIEARA